MFSILLPYYKRSAQLKNTLSSFYQYDRDLFEVIIVEDLKNLNNNEEHLKLLNAIDEYKNNLDIKYLKDPQSGWGPSTKYNLAAKNAKYDYFVISNPECLHKTNVLMGFKEEFDLDKNSYVIGACEDLKENGEFDHWNHHSVYYNNQMHFISAISRENYFKINGFDERFKQDICYDDDYFLLVVKLGGLKIVCRDDLIVSHQFHERDVLQSPCGSKNKELFEKIKKELFLKK